jgi:hypothetical protein
MHEIHSELMQKYKSGANWFYWIAGLTLVTSILTFSGADWRFLISLGTTQFFDAVGQAASTDSAGAPKIIALVLDAFLIAIFILCGVLANKRMLWAYVAGMVLFFLDGIVSLLISDWIGVVAHVVVLIFMVPGILAGRKLDELERMTAAEAQQAVSV